MVFIDLFNALLEIFFIGFNNVWNLLFQIGMPLFNMTVGEFVLSFVALSIFIGVSFNLLVEKGDKK